MRLVCRLDGDKSPMPMFAGQRGPHISRSLLEIEATFEKHLQRLRSLKSGILDVKSPEWHDEYNRFRAGVKDLEVMVQNLISSAFETVRTVESGVMLLEIFQHLGTRESIKRAIDRKTAEVCHPPTLLLTPLRTYLPISSRERQVCKMIRSFGNNKAIVRC